ncbi:MAG TPA: alpha/beta hydrolase [Pseudonocardiaceae bacterium]|jgi:pimeloyl-ACP methyl ester carboxylesterase|nr:alpha/beta hydrolase [Pseudonocardiaceae bacterium]
MTTNQDTVIRRSVQLPSGKLDYREAGTGPPVVFVHGAVVNSGLWRHVLPLVAEAGFRCLAVDLPLGSHTTPMPPGADLSPPGLAGLIAEFLDTLDLTEVTVVANDTGGALTQILMAEHPERLAGVVLTPCDALDCFFPPMFAPLTKFARLPGSMWVLAQLLRWQVVRRSPLAYGFLTKRPIPDDVLDSYVGPARRDRAIRRDTRRFLTAVHHRYTEAAAERLPDFDHPVLLVSAADDRVFPARLFQRLAELLPKVRRATVADSYTFVPEDQPAELARLVVDFLRSGS